MTNAGTGSNLTECGVVECDAGLMDGGGGFGAVGAAPGVSQGCLIWEQKQRRVSNLNSC